MAHKPYEKTGAVFEVVPFFIAMVMSMHPRDFACGTRTVEEAREFCGETAVAFIMGRPAPNTAGLLFPAPKGGTANRDKTMIAGAMLHQTAVTVQHGCEGRNDYAPTDEEGGEIVVACGRGTEGER